MSPAEKEKVNPEVEDFAARPKALCHPTSATPTIPVEEEAVEL
jgi:hypothetical protein